MPKETTYADEINQAAHRPGMEHVVNRGDDARDQSGTREGARRQVSPPTRSAFGADSAADAAPKEEVTAATPSAADTSGVGGRQREATVMSEVEKAGG